MRYRIFVFEVGETQALSGRGRLVAREGDLGVRYNIPDMKSLLNRLSVN